MEEVAQRERLFKEMTALLLSGRRWACEFNKQQAKNNFEKLITPFNNNNTMIRLQ
jgi:hypothetical protein